MSDLEQYEEDLVPLGVALAARAARRAAGKRVRASIGLRLSDTGNAERWTEVNGHRFRMHTDRSQWFVWDETHWRADDNGEALLSTKEVARDLIIHSAGLDDLAERNKTLRWADMSESSARRAGCERGGGAKLGECIGEGTCASWAVEEATASGLAPDKTDLDPMIVGACRGQCMVGLCTEVGSYDCWRCGHYDGGGICKHSPRDFVRDAWAAATNATTWRP